jgi:hypothetical protein
MKITKHFLSLITVACFFLLAVASKVNKIHYGAFSYNNHVEPNEDQDSYLVKNDGTKVYGKRVGYKNGLLNKKQIRIDDQEFKISEVRGYRMGQEYYGRIGNAYIKRIVHGKVNIYVQFTEVSSTSTDRNGFTHTRNYTRTDHYYQLGEAGELKAFGSQSDIKKIVADCPVAFEMADKSNSKIRKAIRKNSNYLNDIFEIYNNGCKPLKK